MFALRSRPDAGRDADVEPAAPPTERRHHRTHREDRRASHLRVLHEEPADRVVRVHVGGEQQARVLDRTAGEHEPLGLHFVGLLPEGLHPRLLDGAPVQIEADDGRAQEDAHVLCLFEVAPVFLTEACRAVAHHEDDVLEARILQQILRFAPVLRIETPGLHTADRERAIVERIELRPGDRPAAVRHVAPLLEVDRIERPAPPAPSPGGAAEPADPRDGEIVRRQADVSARGEILRVRIEVEAAALDHHDGERLLGELQAERDACGSRADHADVGFDVGALIQDEHQTRRAQSAASVRLSR